MLAWLEALTLLERVMFYIAIPATLLLLIQTVLLFVGFGGEHDGDADSPDGTALIDAGHDISIDLDANGTPDCDCGDLHEVPLHDGDAHHGDGAAGPLHILTLRGVVAFLTLFGWSGLLFCQLGLHWLLVLFLAVQIGIIGMVAVAFILREALRLQSDGTLDIRNALGETGTVYLTVPANRAATGKVNVLVQEQMREFEAVTDSEMPISTGSDIIVTGITGGDTLVVKGL